VTYYQLLSGTLPFLGESPMEIAIKRTKEEPRPLENAFPGADSRSCVIVKKLLQPEPGQRYQSATDLIRDLDSILQGPKQTTVRGPETTRKVENVLATAKMKRRIRTLVHWDLITTAVVLAFLSGGLAVRGGAFLETWAASDPTFVARLAMLGAAALSAAAALVVYRKEFTGAGRFASVGLLLALMLLGAVTAGAWIDRYEGSTALATATNTLRALGNAALKPVNLLAIGVVLLFAGTQLSWEREPGSHRVVLARLMMLLGFPMFFLFGLGSSGVDAPFRQIMVMPELAIPVATGSALACFFGALMVTGYNFESQAKAVGAFLSAAGAAGLYAFAVLSSQSARPDPWTALLREPLAGLGQAFRDSGTLLGVVLLLAVVERGVVFAGIRRQERAYRKRF
jgi:hypothetical protein